jgi:zinc protease
MKTDDFYALDVMTMALSLGRSARMNQNIINKGLAINAWAYNPDNRYGGMIILGGSPHEPEELKKGNLIKDEKRDVYVRICQKLEDILIAEVEQLKHELLSERELQRIIKLNQREFLDRMRSNEELAGTLATLEVQVGWTYLIDYLKRISEVTPENIRDVVKKYIRIENKTSVYVIPGGKPDKPPQQYTEVRSVGVSGAKRIVKPDTLQNNSIYPTPSGWRHPLSFDRVPKKIVYPKAQMTKVGTTPLFYLADRTLPLIDLTILVKAGDVDIDNEKTGLADILGNSIIQGGTEHYNPPELAQVLDENAIRISISVAEEVTTIRLSVMKADWERGLDLLEEILTEPAFDPAVLKVVKDKQTVSLARQGEDAHEVAMREAMIWHFNGHRYGRDPLLGIKTIPNINKADLTTFLRTYFVPSNIVMGISGDISLTKAKGGLRKVMASLTQGPSPERNLNDPRQTPPVLALINKPGQVQSQIALVLPSFKRTHPAFWKARLLTDILGGSDSLMYTRLRDDLGIVYSAGFFQTYKWNAGMLVGYIGCKGDKTGTAIKETLKLMGSLRKNVPETDLKLKRLDALNSFVFNVDTPAQLVEVYSRYHMRDEPLDTLEKIQDAYQNVTREKLLKLAGQLFTPKKIQIFVVADATTPVSTEDGTVRTMQEDLTSVAKKLGIPFREIALR